MISTTWTDAPTGFPGSGGVAVRPAACLAAGGNRIVVAPVAAQVQGTGVPVAVRLRAIDERHTARPSYLKDLAGIAPMSTTTENNGTTLGIHPPGRPQS
ncbi:hypothetical protein [Candidatus Blastococcus massiliensis]|uniref:hypothetical protein n=1 Tax=Candidatus Blastococcus massiliensis TaxID=1470358 RepID=UPI0004B92331|nr:hypothetical protein [Candidatus Blastococcus massiliensis]